MDSQEILRVALYVDGPADAQKIHHVSSQRDSSGAADLQGQEVPGTNADPQHLWYRAPKLRRFWGFA